MKLKTTNQLRGIKIRVLDMGQSCKSIIKSIVLGMILVGTLPGCSAIGDAVLNPYESEFSCKGVAGNGKCASTPEAYKDALAADQVNDRKDASAVAAANSVSPAESAFREAQFAKMTKLVRSPVTPVVVPPTVMRILFLPYPGEDDSLNMPQFVFTMMDKPRFILGDYLMQPNGGM